LERADQDPAQIVRTAADIRRRLVTAGWLFGGWMGLVIGAKLIFLSVRPTRSDYEPDRGACVACARCFLFCPNERVRLGLLPPSAIPPPPAAGDPNPKVASPTNRA
jgi:ferredoxin